MPREGNGERLVTLSFAIEDALVRQDFEALNPLLEAREEVIVACELSGGALASRTLANLRETDTRILKLLKLTCNSLSSELREQETKRPPGRSYRTNSGGTSIDVAS